ncbi:hypothetical protein ACPTKM_28340 [Pseudomonas aeruginosa]|uniref:hypothetical protein n=1 Tax=Pseudomonas aeruginosa TaxID=287 RepID=UPI003CC6D9D4
MSNYALNIYNAWVGEMDKLSRSGRKTRAKYLKVRKLTTFFIRSGGVRAAFPL